MTRFLHDRPRVITVGIKHSSDPADRDRIWPMPISEQPNIEGIRLTMASTNELFNTEVFGKRNFDALDQIYTADARILPPGTDMISGRKAIKEFWSNLGQSVNARSAVLASEDVML